MGVTEFEFKWHPPKELNGILEKYVISCDGKENDVSAHSTSTVLKGLKHGTTNTAFVYAVTEPDRAGHGGGPGRHSNSVTFKIAPLGEFRLHKTI